MQLAVSKLCWLLFLRGSFAHRGLQARQPVACTIKEQIHDVKDSCNKQIRKDMNVLIKYTIVS